MVTCELQKAWVAPSFANCRPHSCSFHQQRFNVLGITRAGALSSSTVLLIALHTAFSRACGKNTVPFTCFCLGFQTCLWKWGRVHDLLSLVFWEIVELALHRTVAVNLYHVYHSKLFVRLKVWRGLPSGCFCLIAGTKPQIPKMKEGMIYLAYSFWRLQLRN